MPVRELTSRAFFFLASTLLLAASVFAEPPRPEATEAGVKAAFLYKFAAYVEWPPRVDAAEGPFTIGVLDNDAVASELERIVPGRAVAGHPVVVRRLRRGEPAPDVQVLFVGGDDPDASAIRAAQKQATLVVTESAHGLAAGSAINFVVAGERVGFEVSLDGAEKSGLRISSRMLAVARRVVQKGS